MPGFDVSEIVAEYNSVYIDEGQDLRRLMSMLTVPARTPSFATPLIIPDTIYRGATGAMNDVLQAFQKNFTAKGDVEFKPKAIELFNVKVDWEDYPDDIVQSWLGFLSSVTENDRSKWPLIRYILEGYIMPKIYENLEMKCYYHGEFVAPTPGTPGLTINAMDGLRKLLVAGITTGGMNDLSSIGTVNASNIFDKVEEITDKLTEVFRGTPLIMAMSTKNVVRYLRDRRNTHGLDQNYDPNKLTPDFYESIQIVGLPSMDGTDDIFLTTRSNFKHIRRSGSMKPFKVETAKRQVSVMNDWWEGIGFHYDELVWYYPTPAASGSSSASGSASGSSSASGSGSGSGSSSASGSGSGSGS